MELILFFFWIAISTNEINSAEFNVVGNLTQENELACNTQVILQCIVNPKTDPVFWQVGKPVTSTTSLAARCSGFSCDVNSAVSSIYNFSYDEDSGESNMTIKNVTLVEDGKEYKCDDGLEPLTFETVVQVPPVQETTQITSMNVSGTTQITVSTGCVTPRTAELVKFSWFKIQDGKKEAYTETIPQTSSDESPCQIYSGCITNGSIALSNNLTIVEYSDAPEVYFQVQIFLGKMELFTVITSSTFKPKISDVFNNTCGCNNTCDCDIKELIIVIAVAWGGAITLTFVGSCILKYSLNIADLHECIFKVGSLPWIFLLVVVLLYKGDKKRGLIPLVISFVLDAVFIGIDIYYVCLSENVCDIELLDHLWASFIYLIVCAVLSVLKYIILEKCCDSDSSVSNSNLELKESDVEDKHEQRGARPLPPMTNVSSRPGNEKEHAHSLTHVKITHRSPLPPISPKKNS